MDGWSPVVSSKNMVLQTRKLTHVVEQTSPTWLQTRLAQFRTVSSSWSSSQYSWIESDMTFNTVIWPTVMWSARWSKCSQKTTFTDIEWWIEWCTMAEGQGQITVMLHIFRPTLHVLPGIFWPFKLTKDNTVQPDSSCDVEVACWWFQKLFIWQKRWYVIVHATCKFDVPHLKGQHLALPSCWHF